MGVGAGLYMRDLVKKSSRSLSHLLMSSCNACRRESVKPLLFYCNTMPASLLVEQRKLFSIIRLYIVTILFCVFCVLCIVMRLKNCLLRTFFLDTLAVHRVSKTSHLWLAI